MIGVIKSALTEFFHDAWCGIKAALKDGIVALCKGIYYALPSFRQICDGLYTHYYDQIWSIQGLVFFPLFGFLFRNNYKFRFFLCCAAATYTPMLIDYAKGKTNEVVTLSSEKLVETLDGVQEAAEERYVPCLKNFFQESLEEEDEDVDIFDFFSGLASRKKKETPQMFFTAPKHCCFPALGAFTLALFLHNESILGKGFALSLLFLPIYMACRDAKKFDVGLESPRKTYIKGYLALTFSGALAHFLWSRTQGNLSFLIAALALSIPLVSSYVYVWKVSEHVLGKGHKPTALEKKMEKLEKKIEKLKATPLWQKLDCILKYAVMGIIIYFLWMMLQEKEKLLKEGGRDGDKKFEEKNQDNLKNIQEEVEEEILVMLIAQQNEQSQSAGRGFPMPRFIRKEVREVWQSDLLSLECLARTINVPESAIPRFVACAQILEWAIHNGEKTRADFQRFLDARGMILLEGEELVSGFGFDEGIQEELRRMQRQQRLIERQERRMRTRTRTAEQLREENEQRHRRAADNRQNAAEQGEAQLQRQNDHLADVQQRHQEREREAEQRLQEERQRRQEAQEEALQRREEALEQRREAQNRYEDRRQGIEERRENFRRDNDLLLAANATLDILEQEYMHWNDAERHYYERYVLNPLAYEISHALPNAHDRGYLEEVRERLRRLQRRINRSAQQVTNDPSEANQARDNNNGQAQAQNTERIREGGRGGQRVGNRENPRTERGEGNYDGAKTRWGAYGALLGKGMVKNFSPFKPNPRHVQKLTQAAKEVKEALREEQHYTWLIGQRKRNVESYTSFYHKEKNESQFSRFRKWISGRNPAQEREETKRWLEKQSIGLEEAHTQLETAKKDYKETYNKTYKKQEAKVKKSSTLKWKNSLAKKAGEVASGCAMQYVASAVGTYWECATGQNEEVNRELMALEREHDLANRHGLDYVKGFTAFTGRTFYVVGRKIYEEAPELKETAATSAASTVGSTVGWFAGAGIGYFAGNPALGAQIGSSLLGTGGVVATDAVMGKGDTETIDAAEITASAVGAALGSFIPIPVVGTIVGSVVGKGAVKFCRKPEQTIERVGNTIEKTFNWFSSWF